MVFLMNDSESQSLEEIMTLIRSFVAERNWESFHRPSALAVSAAVEADRSPGLSRHGVAGPRADGVRWHLRPSRRRVPSLRGRRPLARAAL